MAPSAYQQQIVGLNLRGHEQHRLHLAGKDVDSPDDKHVIGAPGDAVHAGVGPSADAGLRGQPGDVTRSVTDEWERLLGKSCDDQFAPFALGEGFARVGVDDLRRKWSSFRCNPDWASKHSHDTPGPMISERP